MQVGAFHCALRAAALYAGRLTVRSVVAAAVTYETAFCSYVML